METLELRETQGGSRCPVLVGCFSRMSLNAGQVASKSKKRTEALILTHLVSWLRLVGAVKGLR